MKTLLHFNLLFFVVFILSACDPQGEVASGVIIDTPASMETAVSTRPPITTQPTPIHTPVNEAVVPETAVPTPSPTNTPDRPTPLPTRPSAVPTVPIDQTVTYTLTQPSPESLLDVMRRIGEFEDINVSGDRGGQPYWHVNNFVKIDMDTFYPESFPNAAAVLDDFSLTSYYFGWWTPSRPHYRLIEDGIIQYLNQNQVKLAPNEKLETDPFELRAFPIDIDKDNKPEWVIQVRMGWFRTTKYLLLGEISSGNYVLLSNDLPGFTGRYHHDGVTDIYTNEDLTGDGKNEIIVHNDTYLGGNSNDISFVVYSWSENSLQQFPRIDLSYYSHGENMPAFEIQDFNDDGIKDIQTVRSWDGNFGCDLEVITLHTWQGAKYEEQEFSTTNTPECQLWRSTFSDREIDEEVEFLESALAQWESMTFPPADLIALARLHLAMAQYAKGNYAQAQTTLDMISNLPESSQFGQLVLDAYDAAEKDPVQTCRNMLDKADQTLNTDIGRFLTNYEAIQGWVDIGGELPNLPTICNIQRTAVNILTSAALPINKTPPDLLADLGIRFEFATVVNLDAAPDLEWIGVLEPQIGKIVTFDAQNEIWTYEIEHGTTLAENFEVTRVDVTGDGKKDVVSLVTEKTPCYETMEMGIRQSIELLFTEDESAWFDGPTLPCNPDEFRTLESITADDFSVTPLRIELEWKTLENYSATALTLDQYVAELQTAVIIQSDPTIPTKISELLAYLPVNDLDTQPYIEHLTYLLGYYYELSGDEETAVSTYLDLIQQAPNSPWSWLAWARLEPGE